MADDTLKLTADELKDGWHFCYDWDGLLVGPGLWELVHCHCLRREHPARSTQVKE
jgi:hypothetical protein